VFELGSHGENDGAQGVAGGADGVGDLLGMSALAVLATARTVAGLDVELRDDGRDRRQVGLVLDDRLRVFERHVAVGTVARNVDDAVNLFWRRRGPECGRVSGGPSGFLALRLDMAAAKLVGLPLLLAANLVELPA